MSDPNGEAAAEPTTDETSTENPHGKEREASSTESGQADPAVPELGAEEDLHGGSTGALPEG